MHSTFCLKSLASVTSFGAHNVYKTGALSILIGQMKKARRRSLSPPGFHQIKWQRQDSASACQHRPVQSLRCAGRPSEGRETSASRGVPVKHPAQLQRPCWLSLWGPWASNLHTLVYSFLLCKRRWNTAPAFGGCSGLLLTRIRLFAALWSAALQAPLVRGFSRQESWSGRPFPPPSWGCWEDKIC